MDFKVKEGGLEEDHVTEKSNDRAKRKVDALKDDASCQIFLLAMYQLSRFTLLQLHILIGLGIYFWPTIKR